MLLQKITICTSLIVLFGVFGTEAQESTNTTGGNIIGNGGSVSYSIGQIFFNTYTGTNGSTITEGVQQPYEISIISGIKTAKNISLKFLIYPNPTADFLTLHIEGDQTKELIYQLYDMNSKLLTDKKISGSKTNIEMGKLASAIYFLKIFQGNQEVKTFKIIKN